jgi:hypothetical protein
MKKYLLIVLVIGLLGGACTPEATQTAIIPTETKFATSTPVVVSSPTFTSTVITPTFTVIPRIPTITPTFDVSTLVTVTPAEKAVCPIAQPAENLDFDFLNVVIGMDDENRAHAEENVLNFLNTYGPEPLVSYLRYHWKSEGREFLFEDLTDDDVSELAISLTSFFIFSCRNGQYEKIFELLPDGRAWAPTILFANDNNRNGILELIIRIGTWSQGGRAYHVFEWDGGNFHNLIPSELAGYPEEGEIWVEATTGKIHCEDVDHDLLNEIILVSGVPSWGIYYDGLPWRNETTYYKWNGKNYIPAYHKFSSPEFRFQAIQDGDLAASQSELDKALSLYQDAISSDKLKDFSPEILANLRDNWYSQIGPSKKPTPTPYPADPTEYSRLAAYAYYRIMLLNFVHGYETDALTVFNTLQRKFPDGNPGYPYVEMAKAFMKEYQNTHNIPVSCVTAIQYATENPEILVPLGSDYHGWQSHTYKPEDVCPFR